MLQIRDIKKNYRVNGKIKEILCGISFDVFQGQLVSLLGVNGAGKTTLSSILVTLIPPSSGGIFWKGVSIYKNIYGYRKVIGYCPQKPNFDPILTLEQNLLFAGYYFGLDNRTIKKRKDMLVERFQLEEMINRPLEVLSGGYKQRFLLARMLMHDPKILILDEPTVGLDPSVRKEMIHIIHSLKEEGKTIILATHYLDEAEALSNQVVLINDGLVIQVGSPNKLKEKWSKGKLEDVFLQLIKNPRIFQER